MPTIGAPGLLALALMVVVAESGSAITARDPAWGTPHIYAATDVELARENGREIAKDRLGQLILLARVGRGTLAQAFGLLDPGALDDDIEARRTAYTSSELNRMFAAMPQRQRNAINAYCEGVNDTLDQIYAGSLPEPVEVTILKTLGLGSDLFGNATNLSDQVDPAYRAPGGADPQRPNAGFQFTPELFVSVAILQVRNFGLERFNEASRLAELQALIAKHGAVDGEQIWRDLNFLNDPLAPASVPDPTLPGFGGPLARRRVEPATQLAAARTEPGLEADGAEVPSSAAVPLAQRLPRYDYQASDEALQAAHDARAERARRLGAWPALGSYAWVIASSKSATGHPWLGGFPQTGIQTPSIMHFVENRSDEEVQAIGMEFVGAPAILIGQTDTVAWTSTTAQLRVLDTFFEQIIGEDNDAVRYVDEGTPAPLLQRTEIFRSGGGDTSRVFWRSHERNGNGGTRPIVDFQADAEGTADSGSVGELVDDDASFAGALVGGHVLILDGTGAGQIRSISAVPSGTTLQVGSPWTTPPDATSVYAAVESGHTLVAVAQDSAAWLEETTSAYGFGLLQETANVLEVRAAMRLVPTTHNFPSIDNQPWNGIGANHGNGNIAYYSSGFSRIRQGGEDKLLPLDGSIANPLVVVGGMVSGASPTTLSAVGAFSGLDLAPPNINYRYLNTTDQGREYVVAITGGAGFKQSRRIAGNDADTLTLEAAWGAEPQPGDTFEVYEIVAMPEVVNPTEGYSANWNNKAARSDDGSGFGRNHRTAFILERLAAEDAWDATKQRRLNQDVAGLSGDGNRGRYLVPRLRQAVDAVGNGGNLDVDAVLAALEAHQGSPDFGRSFVDPVLDTTTAGEEQFLSSLISQLSNDIYGDEFSGAVSVPGGSRGLALVIHAIDSAAGDVPGSYAQEYAGDYFDGAGWETVLRDALSALASGGIPADGTRATRTYAHPLAALFPELIFEPTLAGNRGTWEQIVEAGPVVKGEFMFPLGQSGLAQGSLAGGVTAVDPDADSIQPIWRDWRFLPMLHVSEDLQSGGSADNDGDGVFDAYERWYFGSVAVKAKDDSDKDKAKLIDEFLAGSDPTLADTDEDGILDGRDTRPQDRLRSGALKLAGRIAFNTKKPDKDKLALTVKIGPGSPEFDPSANDLQITLTGASGTLYEVTVPAGAMTPNVKGNTFKLVDPGGSNNDLKKAIFKLPSKNTGQGTVRIVTVPTDFSSIDLVAQDVEVVVAIGSHTISDERLWEVKGTRLKSTK